MGSKGRGRRAATAGGYVEPATREGAGMSPPGTSPPGTYPPGVRTTLLPPDRDGAVARFGVEVHDVDLRGLDAGARDELREGFRRHKLLLFRDQDLSDDEHVDVASSFGDIAYEGREERRTVGFVSNHRPDGVLGATAATFHIDYGFFPTPYEALSLYGLEIPPSGTVTWFADAIGAAADLPGDLRARVDGCESRAVVDVTSTVGEAGVRVREGRLDESYPHTCRPVLWSHRDTGEEILAVWEQQTDAILPLPPDESTALLERLFGHLYQAAHRYQHEWRTGDLVVWDNHAVQHARPEVGTDEPRTLRRVCIGDTQDLSIFARYVRK